MTWLIDDIPLSTYAYNVENRSAGWKVPAKRGENLSIPGRNGAQWVPNKSFDVGSLTLTMWAVGALEDGSMPSHGDLRRQARDNLDKLTALFAQSHKLLNVVQISSTAFGVQNVNVNPGFEASTSGAVSYTNDYTNPSMRARGATPQMTNLFANPASVALDTPTWQPTFENLVWDQLNKYNRSNPAVVMTSNYWINPSWETGAASGSAVEATYWNTATSVAATYQNNTASDRTANPDGGTRVFRLLTTAAIAANASIGSKPQFFITAGKVPLFRIRYRRASFNSTTASFQIRLARVNADTGALVVAGTWQDFALPTNATEWRDATYDSFAGSSLQLAADGTEELLISFRTGQAWVSGEGIILDQGVVNVRGTAGHSTTGYFANVASPYFDGDAAWAGTRYGSGISRWDHNPEPRWVASDPTGPEGAYYASTDRPAGDPNGTTMSFLAFGFQRSDQGGQQFVLGTQDFTYEFNTPTYVGHGYTLRFAARGEAGSVTRVNLMKQGTADAAPVVVGVTTTVTGIGTVTNTGANVTGTTGPFVGASYIAQAGDRLFVRVRVPVRNDGYPAFQITRLDLTDYVFNHQGSTPTTANTQYGWAGEVNNSRSIIYKRRVARTNGNQLSTTTPAGYSAPRMLTESIPCGADNQPGVVLLDPVALNATQGVYFSVDALAFIFADAVNQEFVTAQLVVKLLDAGGGVLSTINGPATQLDYPETNLTRMSIRVQPNAVPANTTQVQCSAQLVTPLRGQCLQVTNFLIAAQSLLPADIDAPDYFDGASNGGQWAGVANDSASSYNITAPLQWTVTNGVVVQHATALAAMAVNRSTMPTVTLASAVGSHAAGLYHLGFEVAGVPRDAFEANVSGSVAVSAQIYNGATLLTTLALGTVSNTFTPTVLQGSATLAAFTDVRLVFTSSVNAYSMQVRLHRAMLSLIGADAPLQRINFNRVANPKIEYENTVGYNVAWTASGTVSYIDSFKGAGVRLETNASTITSNRFAVVAGNKLNILTWGRAGLVTRLRYYASATLLTSVDLGPISSLSYTSQAWTHIVPATATAVEIMHLNASGNAGAEVVYSYCAVETAPHEAAGYYDPSVFQYFDGTSNSDAFGQPTAWAGTANASVSRVTPSYVSGWIAGSAPHVVSNPKIKPTNTMGKAGALPRIASGSTRNVRTVGMPTEGRPYVSGEIQVARDSGTSVTVAVYAAASTTGTGTLVYSETVNAVTQKTVSWKDIAIASAYVYVQVGYTEQTNASDYRVWLDNLSVICTSSQLKTEYPGYFDGNFGGAWLGGPNASVSQFYGGGRRAYAEVRDAIDMTSMAGGTRAEFVVDMEIPGAFWEDLVVSTGTVEVSNTELLASRTNPANGVVTKGTEYDLANLLGGTAPIDDAVFTISTTGTVTDVRLTDVATGGWFNLSGTLPAQFIIDNGLFTVRDAGNGNSLITRVTRGGSNQLLPVVPMSSTAPPRLRVTGSGSGSLLISIVARRRYVIA